MYLSESDKFFVGTLAEPVRTCFRLFCGRVCQNGSIDPAAGQSNSLPNLTACIAVTTISDVSSVVRCWHRVGCEEYSW
jgi:hypothetical protein